MKKFTPIVAAMLVLLLIIGGLYWYSYHVGVKEHMDRTMDAVAILEDGRSLDCTVRFLGTLYVDHPSTEIDQFNGDYDGGIWINDFMILHSYSFNRVDEHSIMNGQYYLNRDMSVFVAKVDAADIFPEMESQTAYVVLKSNTPEEYSPILDQLMDSPLPTEIPAGPELDLSPETTAPAESAPVIVTDFSEYEALLDFAEHPETNWLRNAMGCVFTTPEEIDLEFLFYSGFRDGSWDKLSPESEAALIEQGFFREFDIQPMPADRIEEVLQQTFGISLSDCTIPDGWGYVEKEDMYCSNHNDAYDIWEYTITAVEDDGETITIHYTVPDHFYDPSTGNMESAEFEHILTLRRTEEGNIQAVSNVSAKQSSDFSEYAALLDFAAEPNWLALSLGCLFEKPEDIDLYYLFYLGVEHPGSWDDIAPESEDFLISQGFMRDMDLQIMPVEKMDAILRDTFGIELKDVAMPREWRYIEAEDAYCSNHSDAYFPGVPNITAVEDDSQTIVIHYTIDGYWLPGSEEFLDTAHLVLTLVRQEGGAIHAVSNVLAPGA